MTVEDPEGNLEEEGGGGPTMEIYRKCPSPKGGELNINIKQFRTTSLLNIEGEDPWLYYGWT